MTQPTHGSAGFGAGDEGESFVVRDKRRIDPETGQARDHAPSAQEAPMTENADHTTVPGPTGLGDDSTGEPGVSAEVPAEPVAGADGDLAAERLADLQRLQAEYVNYRKRVERDKDVARAAGAAEVIDALLPALDDIHFAREHGDLESGPFSAIAEKLESAMTRVGLERYGQSGEEFDPAIHEALVSQPDAEATTETVAMVMQPGYRIKDRVLRPARVGVKSPQ